MRSLVPGPPPSGRAPLEEPLPGGTSLWRVFRHGKSAPTEFDSRDVTQRFRPVRSSSGSIVPVLYAATSCAGAYFETVFRSWNEDPPPDRAYSIVPADLRGRSRARLVSRRDLRLAKLYGPGLTRLHVTRERLIVPSGENDYAQTARWGQWLWERPEAYDGLVWVSRRHDDAQSMLFFGDRVQPADFEVAQVDRLDDPDVFEELVSFADSCGIHVGFGLAEL